MKHYHSSSMLRAGFSMLCAGFSLLCATASSAEPADEFSGAHKSFFNLLSHGVTDLSARALYQPGNDEDDGPGGFDLQHYSFTSEVADPLGRDRYLRYGFDYDLRLFDFDRVGGARTDTDSVTLHGFGGKLGAGWFPNDDLLVTGTFEPGIYSDLEDSIDEDDFQWFGRGFAAYRVNPGAQILAGLMYDETFDDESLLPIFGLRLQSEDGQLHLSATFPTEAKVSYTVEPELVLYGGYFLSGDEFQAELGRAENVAVHVEDRRLGTGVSYYLSDSLAIGGEVGASVGSRLNFKTREPGQFDDADLEPAVYVAVMVGGNI